jgi:UPF0271 protein
MKTIDINCDMGESYRKTKVGNDEKIMSYVSSCNIACGFHGGDPSTIEKTIKLALKHNVKIGAHPSYPDLSGFGRRPMNVPSDELEALLKYQISAVKGMAEALGGKLHHVKAHGALYNTAVKSAAVAESITKAVASIDPALLIYAPSGAYWKTIAENSGISYISEVFADRNYNDDLTLVSRTEPQAMIEDIGESLDHTLHMLYRKSVKTISGKTKPIEAETICIHGDKAGAELLAQRLNERLHSEGFNITAPEL